MVIADKIVEYEQLTEQVGRYKVIHNIPILTDEERKEKDKDIIFKIINGLSNHRK